MTLDNLAIIITAIAALLSAWFAFEARKKVETVHLLINSRMDELLSTTEKLAHAQGLAEGQSQGQNA